MPLNIRDPIHGFIELNDIESKLIQTYPFQRLRFIHQLSTTFLVYPTGLHTRFDHSLGVLQVASRVIARLKLSSLGEEMDEEDEMVFRLAALLHDIGHPPFSHASEEMGLYAENMDHEKMSEKIINETEIKDLINEELGDENSLDRILFIITGLGKPSSSLDNLFHYLLAGQAGIDRMDYLLRDSYFLGVMYGKFDLERILETMRYDSENDIYWEEGGIHALEQFFLARYFMFTEVYFHKTRRILDYHLSILLREYLKEHGFDSLPTEVDAYMKLNDCEILSWMLKKEELRTIFLERKFLKNIGIESRDHPQPDEIVAWEWLEEKLQENFDENDYFLDKAEKAPYKFESFDVKVEVNGNIVPIHEVSRLIGSLKPIHKRRIYASDERRNEIYEFVTKFLNDKGVRL